MLFYVSQNSTHQKVQYLVEEMEDNQAQKDCTEAVQEII